jgi:phospholipid-translocating ATPase
MFKNKDHEDDKLTDDEDDNAIDPELRLRTVRTAASTITESIAVEQRAARRRSTMLKNKNKKGSSFFRRSAEKNKQASGAATGTAASAAGPRRNVYINCKISPTEANAKGEPLARYPRNKVRTTSKLTFPGFIAALIYLVDRIHCTYFRSKESF